MTDNIISKQERLQKWVHFSSLTLYRMREQKRIRDAEKKARQDKITGGGALGGDGKASISNAFIETILRDEDPFAQLDDSVNQS